MRHCRREGIRGDSAARLVPFLPERLHPYVGRLRERIEAGLAGVDFIAVGALTHSAPVLDIGADLRDL